MRQFPCKNCGADMQFDPGTTQMACEYCGIQNELPESDERVEELDFEAFLEQAEAGGEQQEVAYVRCNGCGAETSFDADITSAECPFCGTSLVMTRSSTRSLKPRSVLPFRIERERAGTLFKAWIGSLWFAPGDLKRRKRMVEKLHGIYTPYWTYDSDTRSHYTGERGDDYWVTEHYTAFENGKSVQKTRQVRKTRWSDVSGRVRDRFDDILVLASESLPAKITRKLEPWDLENLEPYRDEYLSGFSSHAYQIDLRQGFGHARRVMAEVIRSTIRRDIGGDRQRIHSVSTHYDAITFKHLLLPVWLSAYRYKKKVYHFVVNGRTGEVQGSRPWSWIKILLLVLLVLAVAGGIAAVVAVANSR